MTSLVLLDCFYFLSIEISTSSRLTINTVKLKTKKLRPTSNTEIPRNLSERFRRTYLLKLLLVSLTISFTYGDPRMMTTVFQAVNFAREIRGRRLNGSVIREIQMDSESFCRLHCVKESSRVSYNFGSTTNNKKFKCQLSDSDHFASFKNFTEDNKFLYRGVKVRNFRSSFSKLK